MIPSGREATAADDIFSPLAIYDVPIGDCRADLFTGIHQRRIRPLVAVSGVQNNGAALL